MSCAILRVANEEKNRVMIVQLRNCICTRQIEKTGIFQFLRLFARLSICWTVGLSLSVPVNLQSVCHYGLIKYVSPYSGFTTREFSSNKCEYIHLLIKSFQPVKNFFLKKFSYICFIY